MAKSKSKAKAKKPQARHRSNVGAVEKATVADGATEITTDIPIECEPETEQDSKQSHKQHTGQDNLPLSPDDMQTAPDDVKLPAKEVKPPAENSKQPPKNLKPPQEKTIQGNQNEKQQDELDSGSDLDDDDFDPEAKVEQSDSDPEDEAIPDFSAIEASTTQVRTRSKRLNDELSSKNRDSGLVMSQNTSVDIDSLFNSLKSGQLKSDWLSDISSPEPSTAIKPKVEEKPKPVNDLEPQLITIKSCYTFAGKVITETKEVDANSAEAQAYLNSTMAITDDSTEKKHRSFIPIIRKLPGTDENVELRIKLKRPSLIDKFLNGNKKQKLSTLEKSRLDWAGFVDKRKLKDELKIHNKGGYLDKQDFLGRVQAKRDIHYQKAKEKDRLKKLQAQ